MATQSPNRGPLIVFEGLDRSGKTTQSARLVEYLRSKGHRVEHLRFPDRTTPIGRMINAYLSTPSTPQQLSEQASNSGSSAGSATASSTTTATTTTVEDHAIHLLFSANRWEAAPRIERLLASGTIVVVDRYYYSGCVYSAAKGIPGMDLEWCREPEAGLPRPDLCLFFDISPEAVERRGGFGGERYENREMQGRVRGLYAKLREGKHEREDVVLVDAGHSIETVEREVKTAVDEVLKKFTEGESQPLRKIEKW